MKLTQTLLEWVVTSAALILVVLALRALLGKRVSARLRYALWAVVLVRLLVPVQLFHLPFAGAVVFPETQIEETLPPVETSASGQIVGSPTIAAPVLDEVAADHSALAEPNAPAVPSAPKASNMTRIPAWLGWVWLAGSAAVAVVLLACNLRFSQKLRRVRLPLEDADCSLPVYVAVGLPSPCLFGVVRPAVYVTPDAAKNPILLRHVLVHEATHFHHGDHCWNVLRNIALAVHWWNPLVWLAVILSRRDCELACDEGALKRLDAGERIAYGRTLLALVTEKPRASDLFTCATTMTGDQKGVIERVTRIARAPKRWLWAAVVAVIATALACVCAFGAAEETGDGAEPDSAPSAAPLESELNFSIDENGNVAITGTIDGLTLEAGTYWQSVGAPAHTLMMPYAPFDDDDADGYLQAQWNGDDTVLMWSQIMTTPSSDPNAGFWTFSVDLSREQAVVTGMTSLPSSPAKTDSDMKLHLYPESISDEEAVRAARIAAKLLTEAENYYNNHMAGFHDVGGLQKRLMNLPEEFQGDVIIEQLDMVEDGSVKLALSYWLDVSEEERAVGAGKIAEVNLWSRPQFQRVYFGGSENRTGLTCFAQTENNFYFVISQPTSAAFPRDSGPERYLELFDAVPEFIRETVLSAEGVAPFDPEEIAGTLRTVRAVIEEIVYAPGTSFVLGHPNATTTSPYPYIYNVDTPPDDGRAICLREYFYGFAWEELTTEQAALLMEQEGDGVSLLIGPSGVGSSVCITVYKDSPLAAVRTVDNEMKWYRALSLDSNGNYASNHFYYDHLRWWYDDVELNVLRAPNSFIPAQGQSHEEIARQWAEGYEEVLSKTAPGGLYTCTYVQVRDVDAGAAPDWPDLEAMSRVVGPKGLLVEEYGETWFTFSYQVVFVPESEKALNMLIAGNTEEYTGDDAPEGAWRYGRVGYMVLTDQGWTCLEPGCTGL